MLEIIDIHKEYEEIFGVTTHENLFCPDDEEYNSLRQSIIESKREFYKQSELPFSDLKLLPYKEYQLQQIAQEAEAQGYRIFYIRKYDKEKLVCYAAGYFNVKDSKFYVLRDSFFPKSEYFSNTINRVNDFANSMFKVTYSQKEGIVKEKKLHPYDSASLAASYYLGKKSSFLEWKDYRGKTLDAYYPRYKWENIEMLENMTFPGYVAPNQPNTDATSSNIRRGSITEKINIPEKNTHELPEVCFPIGIPHHIFKIEISGICRGYGYHDQEKKRFCVVKGSVFAKDVDYLFEETNLGKSRERFVKSACHTHQQYPRYYVVSADTCCKSATAAASYLAGRETTYSVWRDVNGKYLKDFYPDRYVIGGSRKNEAKCKPEKLGSTNSPIPIFYIVKDSVENRFCDASGTYDPTTKKFILKAGSVLATDPTPAYNYTLKGIGRRKFVSENCYKEKKGYKLKRDCILDSPSEAASYVIGRFVNGWEEWRDINDNTLDTLYRNS